MEDRLQFVLVFLLLGTFAGVSSAVVDFTCITKPRINISSEDTYIAAYLHGGNAELSFARMTFTRTGSDDEKKPTVLHLPSAHTFAMPSSPSGDEILIFGLPSAGGKTRIGFFTCQLGTQGTTGSHRIGTLIMNKNADFLPTRVSQTVNRGDAVNLTITATNPARTNSRWRKDGDDKVISKDKLFLIRANVQNSGNYEVHFAGERNTGKQALMRLIVRGCPEMKWNPSSSCDADCPVCLNGGVCDDKSEDCICPPGFSGNLCETPEGPNRFGQLGSFRCDSAELGGGPTCAGMLFCLPDPYGCSCAAGYQGIDCDEICADGFYGANCAQTCHCMDGAPCNITTGKCPGRCAPGFSGINCQERPTVVDFTCITKPRIDISNEDTYIAAYLHGGNTEVSFARTTFTDTGTDQLPFYHQNSVQPIREDGSILRLASTGGLTRIGAFACNARIAGKGDVSIGTVIMSKAADFLPTRVSQTVNRGDVVNLTITAANPDRIYSRWRKDDSKPYTNSSGSLYFDFINADISDTGIYEVHNATKRGTGKQALMRLLVRGCGRHVWNAPSCDSDCPVCFNGGVCDDRSGECICPPGFGGSNCETILEPNRFGQLGSFRCDSAELESSPTCAGMLFCLPDPYGCSCAAGYQGIDCKETCADGFYGADCAQTCHCMDGAACDKTTGECPGDCAPRFMGTNCQDFTMKPENISFSVNNGQSSIDFRWNPVNFPNSDQDIKNYVYRLARREPNNREEQVGRVEGASVTLELDNSSPCALTFKVAAETSKGIGPYSKNIQFKNATTVPLPVSELTVTAISSQKLLVSWRAPATSQDNPCPADNYLVTYELTIRDQCEEVHHEPSGVNTTANTWILLRNLEAYSSYRVNVTSRTMAANSTTISSVGRTRETAPLVALKFNSSESTPDNITFNWNSIPCGSKGGRITYRTELTSLGRQINSKDVTTESVTFGGLLPCTLYTLRVWAHTRGRNGLPMEVQQNTDPDAPEFSFSEITPNSITFNWNPITCGSTVDNIMYRTKLMPLRKEIRVKTVFTESVTYNGLSPCTNYTLQVWAVTGAGRGPPMEVQQQTNTIAPDAVKNLSFTVFGHEQLNIKWNASTNPDNSCPATDYNVTYELTNLEQCQEMQGNSQTRNTSTTATSLRGLKAHSTYRVTVTPRNEAGFGRPVSEETQTGWTAPTAAPANVTSVARLFSLTFRWDPVPCGRRGGPIRKYLYHFGKSGNAALIRNRRTSDDTVTVNSLSACTAYWFKVQANEPEVGSWTNEIQAVTQTIVPDPVEGLTVTPHGHDQLGVQWSASSNPDNRCYAADYRVTYKLINLEQCQEMMDHNVSARSVSDTEITIDGLQAYSSYNVTVTSRNQVGYGPTLYRIVQTGESVPTAAPVLQSTATNDSVTVSWNQLPCGSRHGDITHYNYRFRGQGEQDEDETVVKKNTSELSVTFHGLSPCTTYSFRVRAFTRIGAGVWTNWIQQDTVVIDEIKSFNLEPSTNEIKASWTTAGSEDNPCPVTSYHVSYQLVNLEQCQPQTDPVLVHTTVNDNEFNMTSMHAYSTYSVQVVPAKNTDAKYMKSETVTTDEGEPLVAPKFKDVLLTNQSVRVTWEPIPCGKKGGNITGYTHELRDASGSMIGTDNTVTESVEVEGLTQGASYSFRLRAFTHVGPGPWNETDFKMPIVYSPEETPDSKSSGGSIVGVIIFLLLAVIAVILIAIVVKKRRQRRAEEEKKAGVGGGLQDVYVNGDQSGVELKNLPSTSGYKPSADKSVTSSTNPPTSTDQAAVAVSSKAGPSTSSADSAPVPGPSTSTKAPVRPKPYVKPTTKPKGKALAKSRPQAGPVAMTELGEYIKRRTAGKVNGFQQDYELIPGQPIHPWTIAKLDHNKKNNRYNNILAYDHSRVVLECLDDKPYSDYINASYINGYRQEHKYIASQGPTKASVPDMWRMVWQEQVGKVVMLTNLVENGKGKCEQYWPDGIADYGDLFVRKVDETKHPNYIVRTFHVSKSSEPEGEYRELIQFHYTTWPDMKPPESSPLLQFVRRVQATETLHSGPIIVHCSAGVGRTGTFITLDSMLEMAEAEGQVDVLKFVSDMREQRFLMVQTLDQYKFIFDALLESMLSENTAIGADRFHLSYAKLKKRDKKTGTTGIEAQFQMLESFTATPSEEQCMGGRNASNVDKNRFKDCIPKDSTRPYLMTAGDAGSTNYINATFLDGYNTKHAYLATQAPLPNTRGDIWRMVFDYKSSCIVMLNKDPSLAQYWPQKGSLAFGPLTVTLTSEDNSCEDIIIRQFDISYPLRKNDEVQSVRQIQYLGWPSGKEVASSPSSLLKVLEAVKMWQTDHPDGPVTVHCIDGVGCTGTFCALLTLLDHLAVDKVVDVFQAVKKLRTTRAGMVSTLAQYQLCYQVIQSYLDSGSIYENYR